jgi:plasmid replication initiation protein
MGRKKENLAETAETGIVVLPARRGDTVVEGKQVLRKHVAAIHTSGELGLLERKLVNVLLLNAYDQLTTARMHRIPTKILMAMLGWTEGEDTVHLKKALLRIVSTPVEFNLMDPDGDPGKTKRWTATALLAQADIVNGHCEYEYSSRLAEELSDPDVYAIINVGIQRQFKSGYALTLYENCVRFRRTGSTGLMALATFRKIMGATSPTYEDFRRLSELVLNKAVKEVNSVSDIIVTPEFERIGRKVMRIKFTVEDKAQQSIFTENQQMVEEVKKTETFKRLLHHGIGEKLAISWVMTDERRAVAALDITEQRARNNQIKTTTSGYVRRLIEDTSIDLSPSGFAKEMEQARSSRKANEEQATAEKQQAEAHSLARGDKVKKLVKELTDEEVRVYAAEYVLVDGAGSSTSYNAATGKFGSAIERVPFIAWLRKQVAVKAGL